MMMMMMRNPVANPPVILPVMKRPEHGRIRRRRHEDGVPRSGRRGQGFSKGTGFGTHADHPAAPRAARRQASHRRTIDLSGGATDVSVNLGTRWITGRSPATGQ